MNFVAVLIADPRRPVLDEALLGRALAASGGSAPRWLDPGIAAEFLLVGDVDPAQAANALRSLLGDLPVDIAIVPEAGRKKRLFVADMDSTMIEQECLDELAAEFDLKEHVAGITERAMRGEIAFEPALRERVALLAGREAAAIERVHARITEMPGGRTLIATLRANRCHTALVSGGFTAFTGPVAARLGFDENRGNELLLEGATMQGLVAEPILGREAKLAALIEMRDRLGLSPADTMAVGDGANDLAMIAEAGMGVAFHAKPAVAAAAPVRIDHGDLTALLYLQGFSRSEFLAS